MTGPIMQGLLFLKCTILFIIMVIYCTVTFFTMLLYVLSNNTANVQSCLVSWTVSHCLGCVAEFGCLDRFGSKARRIFRLLYVKKRLEQKQVRLLLLTVSILSFFSVAKEKTEGPPCWIYFFI